MIVGSLHNEYLGAQNRDVTRPPLPNDALQLTCVLVKQHFRPATSRRKRGPADAKLRRLDSPREVTVHDTVKVTGLMLTRGPLCFDPPPVVVPVPMLVRASPEGQRA